MIQGLVPVEMRSVAAAIFLFVLNIIGMGLGPQAVGILSDYFAPQYGADSLRYSLLVFGCLNLWAAWHYFLAGRTLKADMASIAAAVAATDAAPAADTAGADGGIEGSSHG